MVLAPEVVVLMLLPPKVISSHSGSMVGMEWDSTLGWEQNTTITVPSEEGEEREREREYVIWVGGGGEGSGISVPSGRVQIGANTTLVALSMSSCEFPARLQEKCQNALAHSASV